MGAAPALVGRGRGRPAFVAGRLFFARFALLFRFARFAFRSLGAAFGRAVVRGAGVGAAPALVGRGRGRPAFVPGRLFFARFAFRSLGAAFGRARHRL